MQVHRFDGSNHGQVPVTGLAGFRPSLRDRPSKGGPNAAEPNTSPHANQLRLARFQRECDVVIGPVLLLAAACAVLVFALGLNTLFEEATPAPAAEPTQPRMPPAS